METDTLMLKLRRDKEKRARYTSHRDFLDQCIRYGGIPNGFHLKWFGNIEMDNEIKRKCEQIKRDASIKLMELTRDACKFKLHSLTTEIRQKEGGLGQDLCILSDKYEIEEGTRMRAVKGRKWNKMIESKSHFNEVKVAGDGNCFYRCLSMYHYGDEGSHSIIRYDLVSYMKKNKQWFMQFVDGCYDDHLLGQDFTDGRLESWATEAEIHAASSKYNLDIKVTDRVTNTQQWDTYSYSAGAVTCNLHIPRKVMHLIFSGNHFNLLERVADKTYSAPRQVFSKPSNACVDWFEYSDIESNESQQTGAKLCDKRPGVLTEKTTETKLSLTCSQKQTHQHRPVQGKKVVKWKTRPRNATPIMNKGCHNYTGNKVENGDSPCRKPVTTVTNLSSHCLTAAEESLLGKGLQFIPDRNYIDKVRVLADLSEWERRMRLREFFHSVDTKETVEEDEINPEEKFKVQKKSRFTPGKGRDKWLDLYVELVKNDVIANLRRTKTLNIKKEEQEAFHTLLHNENIVIRPADKGSGIVVMDKCNYIDSLYKEMEASTAYNQTEINLTTAATKSVKKLVNRMYREGAITGDMKQYLVPRYPASGSLKGNPKLHKEGTPCRVIVSGIDTPTEKLAEVAEYELNEYVTGTPSYIRDTTDFIVKLKEIREPIPQNAILFCFDVCKLYPSIPRKEGMEACECALDNRSRPIIPKKYVMEMISTVLDHNSFSLGDKHFTQTGGVAIGSKLGKNFACSYMRKWDEKLLGFEEQPAFYKRFIDDGFGVWTGELEGLRKFAEYANNIHENIKIELRWDRRKIEFLDTWVKLDDGQIYTDLYRKPTDKQLYLHEKSCHPPHTKKALSYGLAVRLKRICERGEDYSRHRKDLKVQLRKRGYSGRFIEKELQKVDALDRAALLKGVVGKKQNERVPLVLTYSRMLPDIGSIVKKHQKVLHQSERMKEVFKEPALVAYRRDRNLCDTLVHGKTNKAVRSRTTGPCSQNCKVCPIMMSEPCSDTHGTRSFSTVTNVSCKERNVVYGLRCGQCKKIVYVGETERSLGERVQEHLADIRLKRDKPVNKHFREHIKPIVEVLVLERLFKENIFYRLLKEEEWIDKLATYVPHGCNVQRTTA